MHKFGLFNPIKAGTEVYIVYKPLLRVVRCRINYWDAQRCCYIVNHREHPRLLGQCVYREEVFTNPVDAEKMREKYMEESNGY